MKKVIGILILALLAFSGSASAAEHVSMDLNLSAAESSAQTDVFHAVVTGKDQLILKPGPVFTEGGNYEGIQLPYLISAVKSIAYPRWALRQGWQGDFSIAIEILTNGNVGRYKVMKSTGYKTLDETATEAVKTWKFHAAMKDGKPVLTCIQIPVRFQINDKS